MIVPLHARFMLLFQQSNNAEQVSAVDEVLL